MGQILSFTYALPFAPKEDFISPSLAKWERDLNRVLTTAQKDYVLQFKNLP